MWQEYIIFGEYEVEQKKLPEEFHWAKPAQVKN